MLKKPQVNVKILIVIFSADYEDMDLKRKTVSATNSKEILQSESEKRGCFEIFNEEDNLESVKYGADIKSGRSLLPILESEPFIAYSEEDEKEISRPLKREPFVIYSEEDELVSSPPEYNVHIGSSSNDIRNQEEKHVTQSSKSSSVEGKHNFYFRFYKFISCKWSQYIHLNSTEFT